MTSPKKPISQSISQDGIPYDHPFPDWIVKRPDHRLDEAAITLRQAKTSYSSHEPAVYIGPGLQGLTYRARDHRWYGYNRGSVRVWAGCLAGML